MTDHANNAAHQANPGENDAFDAPHQVNPTVEDVPEEAQEVAVQSEIGGGPAVTDPEQLRLARESVGVDIGDGAAADGTNPEEGAVESVPEGSAKEVLEWVGDDKDRARAALKAEAAGEQRKGLTHDLQEIVGE